MARMGNARYEPLDPSGSETARIPEVSLLGGLQRGRDHPERQSAGLLLRLPALRASLADPSELDHAEHHGASRDLGEG